ncbi:MAG TPA: PIN domain-containing protein [Thermoanaerobaculia bacterium]|nr:PIN domain-containing protein [Thermoanaerobaculia bacterium]
MKFLLDTSVYLTVLHDRSFAVAAEPMLRRIAPQMVLSSVVRAELTQGARGEPGRLLVAKLARALERVGRVISPIHEDWVEAASIQSKIWDQRPSLRSKRLLNDLLIARSARRVGACVVTDNEGDFDLIGRWIPIEVLRSTDLLAR